VAGAGSDRGGEAAAPSPTPGRRPDLPREFVLDQRRQRVLGAVAELAHEVGVGAVTGSGICRLSRIAKNTFYELFDSVSDCRRYCFAEAYAVVVDPVREASAEPRSWLAGLSAALAAFYAAIAAEPLLAELCLLHSLGAVEEAQGNDNEAAVAAMVEVLDGGRAAGRAARGMAYREPPALAEDYLARMIVSLAALRVRRGEVAALAEQRSELVILVASPFLGSEQAEQAWRELRLGGAVRPSRQ
jgi:AcrR family transcriptional regulator